MIEFAIRRPVAVLMLCIGLMAMGFVAIKKIPMQMMPDMENVDYSVVTFMKGASAEEVEALITVPLERALSTLPGLVKSSSKSEKERSEISISLKRGLDALQTMTNIRDKIDGAGVGESSGRSRIIRANSNAEPVISLGVTSKNNTLDLFLLSKQLRDTLMRQLERIEGVALVSLLGAPVERIEIVADPTSIASFQIPLSQVAEAIQAQNKSYSAGDIEHDGKRAAVRLGTPIQSVDELKKVVVKRDAGKTIELQSIARVEIKTEVPGVRTHLNGKPAMVLEIRKEAEANAVDVAKKVWDVLNAYNKENEESVSITPLSDQGRAIELAIDNVSGSVLNGALFAAVIIFILLQSAWPTFVIVTAIPLSLMLTIILMHFTGVTFNLMSLAGLALGVGMLVDNSTVVLESINNAALNIKDKGEAALWGTRRVFSAILASTLTAMAVFGPLVMVEGQIGDMFKDVALTICYSLASSLLAAVFLIPMLSANRPSFKASKKIFSPLKGIRPLSGSLYVIHFKRYVQVFKKIPAMILWAIGEAQSRIVKKIAVLLGQFYSKNIYPLLAKVTEFLYVVEAHLKKTIPLFMQRRAWSFKLGLGVSAVGVMILFFRGAELFPDEVGSTLTYDLSYPSDQEINLTENYAKALQEKIIKIENVKSIGAFVGEKGQNSVRFLITTEADMNMEVAESVSALLKGVPDLLYKKRASTGGGSKSNPVEVEVFSEDLGLLRRLSTSLVSELGRISELTDVESSIRPLNREIVIDFDRQRLALYGVDIGLFTAPVKSYLSGVSAGKITQDGEDRPIDIMVPKETLNNSTKISQMSVQAEDKRLYLSSVSTVKDQDSEPSILRINRKRALRVSANLNDTDLGTAISKVKAKLGNQEALKNVGWRIGGQEEERAESARSLGKAILLSVFLIYLLLAAQFESLVQPVIILCAVPLCFAGVAVFLLLFNLNISSFVFVGFIILVGSSVNTSIVMVEFANQLLAEGASVKDAILQATVKRMRPILITTAANIIGLIPMALALGEGTASQQPLAVTVIGGLISSTALTVVLVPVVYEAMTRNRLSGNTKTQQFA